MVVEADDNDLLNDVLVTHILTELEMLTEGLLLANYSKQQMQRCGERTNRSRFNSKFGASPAVICTIYEDLQKSSAKDTNINPPRLMRMEGSRANLTWLLRSMIYLKKYPLEGDFETIFHLSPRYARGQIWETIEKIQYLKFQKVTWSDDYASADIWIMTVDGTHVWIEEPGHAIYSQDSRYFSHKFNKAGINYELGISIASGRLIWMNGPFKAGRNDLNIFIEEGLEQRLLLLGKKAIGDGIYRGHEEAISYPNYNDSYGVKKFKSRALKRHEDFNGMTKTFKILNNRF